MFRVFGVVLLVLAIAIAVVPMFTDCQSQGKALTLANGNSVPMKCHWTGVAEIATGVPLAAVGIMMVASRRKGTILSLGIMGSILGVFAIWLPNGLIGVCQSSMLCNTVMKPTLTILGSLALAGSLGAMILTSKIHTT